ncbi:MAG TPA: hypothetical protein VGE12_05345 [Noviherbaspirillum sp.]
MTTIIAGRMQQQSAVEDTMEELERAGFVRDRLASFYVNPPGQHDAYPIGGDHAVSRGAHETDKGAAAGVAAGAAVGLAAAPFLGPVGVATGSLVGAHVGGLVGGLSKMKDRGETGEHGEDADNAVPPRKAGLMLAVAVGDSDQAEQAIRILRSLGATDIERAEGSIENGDWVDFDPLSTPALVEYAPERTRTEGPGQRI